MTMTLIETKTLGTAAASIEFTSIPQDGTDLLVLASLRSTTTNDFTGIAFNGSKTNFSSRNLFGTGTAAQSNTRSDNIMPQTMNGSGFTANTFASSSIYIPNYTASTNKSFSVDSCLENNAAVTVLGLQAFLWSNTAAINSLTIEHGAASTLTAGSTISLYKITKGSDGIVTTSP
jgi:hypothetical protein